MVLYTMRDNARLAKIRQLPCCECGASPPSQAAHSNFGEHGKGKGIKADDKYTIPLCVKCHADFDLYLTLNRETSYQWFLTKLKFIDEVMSEKPNEPLF